METREGSVISMTGGELGRRRPSAAGSVPGYEPLLVRHRGGELQVAGEEAPGELAHRRVRAAVSSRR